MKRVGRYAPSPTGELHLGNLRTALLAWLHARLLGGAFLIRMEDLDTPRVVNNSDSQILNDLEWLGIDWDGPVVYQSQRHDLYRQALDDLIDQKLIYPCFCSRKDIQAKQAKGQSAYPGTCSGISQTTISRSGVGQHNSLRLRINNARIEYCDHILGDAKVDLASTTGDFIVKRADGIFAYHLSVVVDDLNQGVTDIVRGADLASSTANQIYLSQRLKPNSSPMNYWHLPLVTEENGRKMSKRDGSLSASAWRASGKSAEDLISKFANELTLSSSQESLTANELLSELRLSQLKKALILHSDRSQSH